MTGKRRVKASVKKIKLFETGKYKNLSKLQKEKFMFFLMSNEHDVDMIMGHAEMTETDYKRILYILDSLGFKECHVYVFKKFYDEIGSKCFAEDKILEGFRIEEQVKIYDSWLRNFIDGVPDENLKAMAARQIHSNIFGVSC